MEDTQKTVHIPDGWQTPLTEELLTLFTEHLNKCAIFVKNKDVGTLDNDSIAGNVEVECRFGSIHPETLNFTPGIEKDIFYGMRNHLVGLVKKKNWFQEPTSSIGIGIMEKQKSTLVKCIETDYLDVLFDDNIRLTYKLYFSDKNLTVLAKLKLIEAIRKNKFSEDSNLAVTNSSKKQCFDLRLSVASEEQVPLTEFRKEGQFEKYARFAEVKIRRSYSSTTNERIFGGSPVSLSPSIQTTDITLMINELTTLEQQDIMFEYASKHGGNLSVNLVRQLNWTLLQPKGLPALRGNKSAIIRPYSDDIVNQFNDIVYLTNLPGRLKTRDENVWVCSASQYIIAVHFKFVQCIPGNFASSSNLGEESDESSLKIVHFRKKRRTSFKLRKNLTLDMTKIQQSQTPATIQVEHPSYELEMEVLLSVEEELRRMTAVDLTIDMLRDIAAYIYGIKLMAPTPDIISKEVWQRTLENDKKRISLLETVSGKFFSKKPPKRKASFQKEDKVKKQRTAQVEATSFYNQLNRSQEQRSESLIFHLRCFNNFAKGILIQKYVDKVLLGIQRNVSPEDNIGISILDLACGKGGDINKFQNAIRDSRSARYAKIKAYHGFDIAFKTLKDFVKRIESSKKRFGFPILLGELDLGESSELMVGAIKRSMKVWKKSTLTWETFPAETSLGSLSSSIDLVSIQFSLHYMFESSERANSFFKFVSSCLKPEGYLIATSVECNRLIKHLLMAGPGENSFKIRDNKSRILCEVTFDESVTSKLFNPDHKSAEFYGHKYRFKLKDSEKEDAATVSVDAPEWLISITDLYVVSRKNYLRLVLYKNLTKFTQDEVYNPSGSQLLKYSRLLKHMNVLNIDGEVSTAEHDISALYVSIAFQKVKAGSSVSDPISVTELLTEMKESIPDFGSLPEALRAHMLNEVKSSLHVI